jgi:CRISPR/Cas system-associated exonuclease Cas4 (RecB family)
VSPLRLESAAVGGALDGAENGQNGGGFPGGVSGARREDYGNRERMGAHAFANALQQSHILQVGALCLLVQDVYGARPPYGVVVLADGSQERVTFSEELERGVARTMAAMRRVLATGEPPGPGWVGAKCRACGYHPVCWDS